MRTYVIALVGLDGAGKTTQSRELTERLRAADYDAAFVHPSSDLIAFVPGGERIKRALLERLHRPTLASRAARRLLMICFGYPFALLSILLARHRHRDRVVVYDRYRYQFLYDCYGPLAPTLVGTLPKPDRTVWLTADLDTQMARTSGRDRELSRAYYRSAHRFHARLAATYGWTEVDATGAPDRISEDVLTAVCREPSPIAAARTATPSKRRTGR